MSCLDSRGLVNIALVVDIQLAKGILETEDLVLLELRIFPAPQNESEKIQDLQHLQRLPLQLNYVHCGTVYEILGLSSVERLAREVGRRNSGVRGGLRSTV